MKEIFLSQLEADQNKIFKIYQSEPLHYNPVYSFFLHSTAQMIDDKLFPPATEWRDDRCGIIYVKHNNEPVAFLVYDLDYDGNDRNEIVCIKSVYVKHEYRLNGIFKKMHDHLISYIKRKGYTHLIIIAYGNTDLEKCLDKLNMSLVCYKTWKRID
jgi:GNAT superfamily N-acetyltransferase